MPKAHNMTRLARPIDQKLDAANVKGDTESQITSTMTKMPSDHHESRVISRCLLKGDAIAHDLGAAG
jgi:hypothetical protein